MEILITGGNGLLGRHLIPVLQERGDTVRVLALPGETTSWLEERGVAVFRGDVRMPDTLTAPLIDAEGVLHLAGMMGLWLRDEGLPRRQRDRYRECVQGGAGRRGQADRAHQLMDGLRHEPGTSRT